MSIDHPTPDDIFKYFDRVGEKRGNLTMQILRRQQQFIDAWDSPLGMQLLKDDVDRHEELLRKTVDEVATPQELAEFRYLKKRIDKICEAINNYDKNIRAVRGIK
uniref:Uncharacterized protein n=1 Tax=viral metagenome TaxID=1070528 RepID=A0A6M3L287_9ZZZZ